MDTLVFQLYNSGGDTGGIESIYHEGQTYLHIPDQGQPQPGAYIDSLSEFFDIAPSGPQQQQQAGYNPYEGEQLLPTTTSGVDLSTHSQSFSYLNLDSSDSIQQQDNAASGSREEEQRRVTRSATRKKSERPSHEVTGSAAAEATSADGETSCKGRNEDILTKATRSIMEPTEDYFPSNKRIKTHGELSVMSCSITA